MAIFQPLLIEDISCNIFVASRRHHKSVILLGKPAQAFRLTKGLTTPGPDTEKYLENGTTNGIELAEAGATAIEGLGPQNILKIESPITPFPSLEEAINGRLLGE